MARPARPERSRSALSLRQLSRFCYLINSDMVFGTHRALLGHQRSISGTANLMNDAAHGSFRAILPIRREYRQTDSVSGRGGQLDRNGDSQATLISSFLLPMLRSLRACGAI